MTSPYRLIGLSFMLVGMGVLFSCAATTVPLEQQTPLVKNQPYEGTQQNMDYQSIEVPPGAVTLAFSHFAQEYAARPILRRR